MPTFLATDGTRLHHDTWGEGETRIVLAGGATRHPSYLGDLAGLDGRLVVPHLRGVGDTPAPASPEAGSWWRQAQDLEDLRKHLELDKVTLIAHSAGTRLAIAYGVQYPDRVARLLLITPPSTYLVDIESDADEITAHRKGDPDFDRAVEVMRRTATNQDEFDAWRTDSAPATYANWTDKEQAHAAVGEHRFATVQAYFSVQPPADLAERLQTIAAPVRIIASAQDYTTGLAPVLALAKRFPNGEAVVIGDCGHYPFVEQPALFKKVAEEALAP